ncbi:hypothetical protein D3C80_1621590 [compost metagenome]
MQVVDPLTGHVNLLVTGISTDRLASSHDISNLVNELREELARSRQVFPQAKAG